MHEPGRASTSRARPSIGPACGGVRRSPRRAADLSVRAAVVLGGPRRRRAARRRAPRPPPAHVAARRAPGHRGADVRAAAHADAPPISASTGCTVRLGGRPGVSRDARPRPRRCGPRRDGADFVVHAPLVLPDAGRDRAVASARRRRRRRAALRDPQPRAPMAARRVAASCQRAARGAGGCATAGRAARPDQRALGPARDVRAALRALARLGIELGPGFRTLHSASPRWRGAGARALPEGALPMGDSAHPGLLDGALQAVGLALPEDDADGDVYLFAGVDSVHLAGRCRRRSGATRACARRDEAQPTQWLADVTLRDDDGARSAASKAWRCAAPPANRSRRAVGAGAGARPGLPGGVGAGAAAAAASRLVPPRASTPRCPPLRRRWPPSTAWPSTTSCCRTRPAQRGVCGAGPARARLRRRTGALFSRRPEAARARRRRATRACSRACCRCSPRTACWLPGRGFDVCRRARTPRRRARRYDALLGALRPVDGELSMLRRCGERAGAGAARRAGSVAAAVPRRLVRRSAQAVRRVALCAHLQRRARRGRSAAIARLPATRAAARPRDRRRHRRHHDVVLPLLPRRRTEYTFTDLSPLFLSARPRTSPASRSCARAARHRARSGDAGLRRGRLRHRHRRQRAARSADLGTRCGTRARCWPPAGSCCCSRAWRRSAGSTSASVSPKVGGVSPTPRCAPTTR